MQIVPVRRRRLYQDVAHHLERMIGSGALAEGEPLPSERELMQQFEVGRPAIREALLSLQQKGLVSLSNGERARVTRPDTERLIAALSGAAQFYLGSADGVRHFQATRKTFEIAAVRDVAANGDAEAHRRIGEALEVNAEALGRRSDFETSDVAFHLEIVRSLKNPLLTGIHQALSGWLTEQRAVSLRIEGAEANALAFHRRIYAALLDRDADEAEAAMREHLDWVAAYYWRSA